MHGCSDTNLVESVFLGLTMDLPELEPSRDFVRLSPLTGLYLWNRNDFVHIRYSERVVATVSKEVDVKKLLHAN